MSLNSMGELFQNCDRGKGGGRIRSNQLIGVNQACMLLVH